MIIPYLPAAANDPIPSLGGSLLRYRPVKAVRITGPMGSKLRDGLVDTGADDTVLEEWVAQAIGLDLTGAEERPLGLVGRPQPVRCKYAPVRLLFTDGVSETYEWDAVVAFTPTRLRYCLFGYAGFLQFFDAEFRGAGRQLVLTANRSFPGRGP